nr:gustatory receptor 28b [Fopius arisanus]
MYSRLKNFVRQSLFTSCYIFFKILGLIPCYLQELKSKSSPSYIFMSSHEALIYNVGLILIFPILSFYSIYALTYSEYPNKSAITEAFEFFKAVLGSIILEILWTSILLNRRKIRIMANRVVNIDYAFAKDKNISAHETRLLQWAFICGFNVFS